MIGGKQFAHADDQSGLLADFADDGGDWTFVKFDISGWQAPVAKLRINCTPHEQHLAIALNERADGELGLTEKDKAAGAAGTAYPTKHAAVGHWRTAVGTKVELERFHRLRLWTIHAVTPRMRTRAASISSTIRNGLTAG
jgi:hypothetical protein